MRIPTNEINLRSPEFRAVEKGKEMALVGYLNGNPMQHSQILTHKATGVKYWYKRAERDVIVVYRDREEYYFAPEEFRGEVDVRSAGKAK